MRTFVPFDYDNKLNITKYAYPSRKSYYYHTTIKSPWLTLEIHPSHIVNYTMRRPYKSGCLDKNQHRVSKDNKIDIDCVL